MTFWTLTSGFSNGRDFRNLLELRNPKILRVSFHTLIQGKNSENPVQKFRISGVRISTWYGAVAQSGHNDFSSSVKLLSNFCYTKKKLRNDAGEVQKEGYGPRLGTSL